MACGVPVVSSDAGALPDVVGGAGIVVPAGDAAALGDALVEAAGPRADELRASGFERAATCTWDAVGRDVPRPVPIGAARGIRAVGDPPGLEIVVVAYGAPELLRARWRRSTGLPVTVVDNSSLPEIAALCDELGVRYLDPGRNGGFAAGVNIALARPARARRRRAAAEPRRASSRADDRGCCSARSAREPDLASVGPAQVDDDGPLAQVEWTFPSPARRVARGGRARAAAVAGRGS